MTLSQQSSSFKGLIISKIFSDYDDKKPKTPKICEHFREFYNITTMSLQMLSYPSRNPCEITLSFFHP